MTTIFDSKQDSGARFKLTTIKWKSEVIEALSQVQIEAKESYSGALGNTSIQVRARKTDPAKASSRWQDSAIKLHLCQAGFVGDADCRHLCGT